MVLLLVGSLSLGFIMGNQKQSDQDNVMEVMLDNSKTQSEKLLYLKERYDTEVTTWNTYKSYSDLCSQRYLGDLKILTQKIENTSQGYELLIKQGLTVESDSVIANAFSKHKERGTLLKTLSEEIDNKQYEKAIIVLKDIQTLDSYKTDQLNAQIEALLNSSKGK